MSPRERMSTSSSAVTPIIFAASLRSTNLPAIGGSSAATYGVSVDSQFARPIIPPVAFVWPACAGLSLFRERPNVPRRRAAMTRIVLLHEQVPVNVSHAPQSQRAVHLIHLIDGNDARPRVHNRNLLFAIGRLKGERDELVRKRRSLGGHGPLRLGLRELHRQRYSANCNANDQSISRGSHWSPKPLRGCGIWGRQ